jgi:hypothetical protein
MMALSNATIPDLPKRERPFVPGLYEEYMDLRARFKRLWPKLRKARAAGNRALLLQQALPESPARAIRKLSKRIETFRIGTSTRRAMRRGMTPEEAAVEYLALTRGVDPHTIRDWLRVPKTRARILQDWERPEPSFEPGAPEFPLT